MAIGSLLQLAEFSSKPSAPPAGFIAMYVKSDNTIYIQDSSGNEYAFGSTTAISQLSGEAVAVGPGNAVVTLDNNSVIGKVLNGFSSGPNSVVQATDTILEAIEKLQAQVSAGAGAAITSLTGDVSGTGPGATTTTVNSVGGKTASDIASATTAVDNATPSNTASTLVERDASGNFSANQITATLIGNASTATTSTNFSGSLSGDVTGTQSATTVATVGGKTASDIASATTAVDNATPSNTASTLVERDASGNFSAGTISANLNGTATNATTSVYFSGSLSGDVTGTQSATSIASTVVTGKVLTGFSVGANTPITATDTILSALGKLQGQINNTDLTAITALTGDGTAAGPGSATFTLSTVNSTPGNFGTASSVSTLTVNAKGLVTASSNTPIQISESQVTGLTSDLNSKMNNIAFTASQMVYVAVGGSDLTGDGSIGNPWSTVSHALSQITTAGSNNRFIIKLMGGKIIDSTTPLLKPWVYIVGDSGDGTYWKVTAAGNNIGLDSSWATVGGGRAGIQNVYLGSGTNLNLDLNSIGPSTGTPSAVIDLENISVTGNLNFYGRVPDIDYLQLRNVYVLGNYNADAAQVNAIGLQVGGSSSLTSNVAGSDSEYISSIFNGNVTISGSNTNTESITASSMLGTLTVSGSAVIISDVVTLPIHSKLSISSGTITLLGDAYNLNYTPAVSANWTLVPSTVQAGLDNLAASVHSISGSAITSLTGDVAATGPGAAASTIQPNVVNNSKLAQMPANTIKGNNTGLTANAADLTSTQVTAMLNVFIGDSGSGGTKGLVPAPASATFSAGDFLSAGGSWLYVDQSKPIFNPFSFIAITQYTAATSVKYENLTTYTGIDGHKQYAAVVAGGTNGTLFIWDITNPTLPVFCSYVSLAGAYNISVAQISGAIYAFVPSSGSSVLYVINITNPYSLTTTSSLTISGSPGSLYSCVYSNGYVYIATQNKGLTVVDVGGGLAGGTITAPIQSYQEGGTTNKTGGVAVYGNFVYTTNYQTTFPATVRYLKTWELAAGGGTLAVPFLANTYTISGGPTSTSTKPLGIAISPSGTAAFVTDGNQNVIDIIDVTTPTSPNYLTYVTPSYTLADNTLETAVVSATISGNYLYIPSGNNATNGGCVDLFDVTNLSSPIKVKSIYTETANDVFGGIALNNGYIFGADYGISGGYSGLAVFTQAYLSPTFGLPVVSNIQVAQLTANTALIANGNQQLASSSTTATELGYVHGVTSSIQAQLNSISGSALTGITGDVVATGPGSASSTIQANVVSNGKLAQMPANTIKGNNTGSTANAADLTETQVAGMLSSFFDSNGAAATVQTNLTNYIDPTSIQLSWDYNNPHYYSELIYTGSNVTQINYWDSSSKVTKLFSKAITYSGGLVSQVVVTRISDGKTLTKNFAYSGSLVSSVTRS